MEDEFILVSGFRDLKLKSIAPLFLSQCIVKQGA